MAGDGREKLAFVLLRRGDARMENIRPKSDPDANTAQFVGWTQGDDEGSGILKLRKIRKRASHKSNPSAKKRQSFGARWGRAGHYCGLARV